MSHSELRTQLGYSALCLGVLGIIGCSGEVPGGTQLPPEPTAGADVPVPTGTEAPPGTAGGPGTVVGPGPESMGTPSLGHVSMRRLSRVEYDLTVKDLLGTTQQPGKGFLNDAPLFAFDNNADQQTLSPTQLEMYQGAAESLAAEAVAAPRPPELASCDLAAGDSCLTEMVTNFGLRAYRRPLSAEEVSALVGLGNTAKDAGATDEEVLRTVVEAMLVSPHFLYRVEVDPDPTSVTPHPVGPYEMASRLSYLVYRSMPDQPLFDAAAAGELTSPEQLQAQLLRMLAEPEGQIFAQDFVGQWLGTRYLETIRFDGELFPNFNTELAASMRAEVESFFDEFVTENKPASELVSSDFSYLDDSLAQHYGLPPVAEGLTERRVLDTPERGGGLLTMAGPLAVTSYPTRTSLVKRGHWVLEKMLCAEPPPPPGDIDNLPDEPLTATSQRELLEQHRAKPECSGCHVMMDNIGIALENYDAIGVYRTTDGGEAIDAFGSFPNAGPTFTGGVELGAVLAQDERFVPCLAEHFLSYALGRTITPKDHAYVEAIASTETGSPGVRDLLTRMVGSEPFRMRRGEPEPTGTEP